MGRGVFGSCTTHHVKGISSHAAQAMIGGAHNELGARSDLTELPDDQMVAKLGIVEQHIVSDCPSGVARPAKQPEFQLVLHQG